MPKKYTIFSSVFYFVGAVFAGLLFFSDFVLLKPAIPQKIITATLMFTFLYLASFVKCISCSDIQKRIKIMYMTLMVLFILYTLIILDFTLIDSDFGRRISNVFVEDRARVARYIENNINLIPFKTIMLFSKGYKSGAVALPAFVQNLIGNFVIFMPFAFFIPSLFPKVKRFGDFVAFCSAFVIAIELLQFLMITGSADVDDFILNVSGASLAYGLLKLNKISAFLNKVTFGVWRN